MLTIHLLVDEKSGEGIVTECLNSVTENFPHWWYKILVGNAGASKETIRACRRYGAEVHEIETRFGMDKCRNSVLSHSKTDWNLYIEPWEILVGDKDFIIDRVSNGGQSALFSVVQGDSVSKQVRLWSKGKFVNPVFERIDLDGESSPCLILAAKFDTIDRDLALAHEWVSDFSAIPDPYYYRACLHLSSGKYDEFMKDAQTYLFVEQDPNSAISVAMMRYYLASVHCYVKQDASKAIQSLAPCLLSGPLMAEFWCLMGDIFYHLMRKYDKAANFYENAMILGSRRLAGDKWPMEVSKYNEHPSRMLANCKEIIKASTKLGSVKTRHPVH